MGELGTGLDAASAARLLRLATSAAAMTAAFTVAMNRCVALVQKRAIANAPVISGTLSRGIRGETHGPLEGAVGVIKTIPYGRRRELGFDGMTDSLGRYYAQDPADPALRANMFFLKRALVASQPDIIDIYSVTINATMHKMFL